MDQSPILLSVQATVEKRHEHWVVFIPLDNGGQELAGITRGLSDIEDDRLKIVIPSWLAEDLKIHEGQRLQIDHLGKTFNIKPV